MADLAQLVVLRTVDPKELEKHLSIESRAEGAFQAFEKKVKTPPQAWKSCVPILGISPPKRPWLLGDVSIIDIKGRRGRELFKAADRVTSSTKHTPEEQRLFKKQQRELLVGQHDGQAFALVCSRAIDSGAAWDSARNKLRFTFDCLNFAVDCLYGPRPHSEFSELEPFKRHFESALVLPASGTLTHMENSVNSPGRPLPAEEFISAVRASKALNRLCTLLSKAQRTGHEERLLAAAHWAGRASAERRPEEAFIFRAIALECLILGRENQGELSFRLALFAVHLFGKSLRDRKDAFETIKRLYGIRSKIVHAGVREVSEADEKAMREVTLKCIAIVLADRRFALMCDEKDLNRWFEASMRGES